MKRLRIIIYIICSILNAIYITNGAESDFLILLKFSLLLCLILYFTLFKLLKIKNTIYIEISILLIIFILSTLIKFLFKILPTA
jgi:hypothetical protein